VDVVDQQPEALTRVNLVSGAGPVFGEVNVHRIDADGLGPPQVVQAAVAGDAVEPRADVDRPIVGHDRVERRGHDLLEDILGVLAGAQQVPAKREQPRLVTGDQNLEGGGVSAARDGDQALIGLEPQQ
jgi:hypothetical protein